MCHICISAGSRVNYRESNFNFLNREFQTCMFDGVN